MEVLAVELGGEAIRVNTINPGAVATPMTTGDSFLKVSREDPEVAWLASGRSRFVTGAAIPVTAR
jgi:NAD(P)-dependent dehydrogenase (short-subunit alcohol dehydrogenase family)